MSDDTRLAQLERKVEQMARRNSPASAVPQLSWRDMKDLIGAQQEIAREQRRVAKAEAQQAARAQDRLEAPARRKRAAELAPISEQIEWHEAQLRELREQYRTLQARPLDHVEAEEPASGPVSRLLRSDNRG